MTVGCGPGPAASKSSALRPTPFEGMSSCWLCVGWTASRGGSTAEQFAAAAWAATGISSSAAKVAKILTGAFLMIIACPLAQRSVSDLGLALSMPLDGGRRQSYLAPEARVGNNKGTR